MLTADIAVLARGTDDAPSHVAVLGEHGAHVERGAYIEPYVLIDTTEGPVLVRRGARIAAFTRLVGPCMIGEDAQVLGGKVKGCSIGEHSRVHGELSGTIFTGHANKAHDGFVGNSVLGRWVNLGAGTITSNLKNSYGEVSLWTPDGTRATGETFLGIVHWRPRETGDWYATHDRAALSVPGRTCSAPRCRRSSSRRSRGEIRRRLPSSNSRSFSRWPHA